MTTIPTGTEHLRPFVPAKDFDVSKRVYEALGFEKTLDDEVEHLAGMRIDGSDGEQHSRLHVDVPHREAFGDGGLGGLNGFLEGHQCGFSRLLRVLDASASCRLVVTRRSSSSSASS